MVLEGLVSSLLNKYLGEFVENLNSSQLNISIFSGNVELQNLRLKKSAFDSFALPVKVEDGVLGKLKLKIPWKSLYTSPTEVLIEDLFFKVYAKNLTSEEHEKLKQSLKMSTLSNMESMLALKLAASESGDNSENNGKKDGYFEKIGAIIVRNLLITIKSINILFIHENDDDCGSFFYGLHLSSLTAKTVDKDYKPCFLKDKVPIFYKLIELDNFCMYWIPQKCNFDLNNINECTQKLNKMDQILILSNFYLKAKINTDPVADPSVPELTIAANLDTLSICINYEMLVESIKFINALQKKNLNFLYEKYHQVKTGNLALDRWKFALNVVLNEHVRPYRNTYNWNYIHEYRNKSRAFETLYISYLKKPDDETKLQLESYEEHLNVMTLFICRHNAMIHVQKIAELKEKEEKSKSWYNRWFGTKNSEIEHNFDIGLTTAQKNEELKKIFDVVGTISESHSNLPKDFQKVNLSLGLEKFSLNLKRTRDDSGLIHMDLIEYTFDFVLYKHKSNSMSVSMTVGDMIINATRSQSYRFNLFNSVNNKDDKGMHLLSCSYESYTPKMKDTDKAISLETQQAELNLDLLFLKEAFEMLYEMPKIESTGLLPVSESMKFDVSTNIDQINSLSNEVYDVSVNVCVSLINICEDFSFTNAEVLIIDLGNLSLLRINDQQLKYTQKFENHTNFFPGSSTMNQFDVTLTDINIRYKNTELSTRNLSSEKPSYLLKPLTISTELIVSKSTTDDSIPSILILTVIENTHLILCEKSLRLLNNVLTSFQSLNSRSSSEDVILLLDDIEAYDPPVAIETDTVLQDFAKITTNNNNKLDSISIDSKKSLKNKKSVEFYMLADKTCFEINFISKPDNIVSNVSVVFMNTSVDFNVDTFNFGLNLQTESTNIDYCSEKIKKNIFEIEKNFTICYSYCKLPSIIQEAFDKHVLTEKHFDKVSTLYEEAYNSTESLLFLNWGNVNAEFCYEVVLSVKLMMEELMASLDSSSANKLELIENNFSNEKKLTKKISKFKNIVLSAKMEIQQFNFNLTYFEKDLTKMSLQKLDACTTLYHNNNAEFSLILSNFSVYDLSYPETLYEQIVSVDAKQDLIDLKIIFDKERYDNCQAPNVFVKLQLARIKFVFLYRYIVNIMNWTTCLTDSTISYSANKSADKTKVSKNKEGFAYINFDVFIAAPLIVIPYKTDEPGYVSANLGEMIMTNKFSFDSTGSIIENDIITLSLKNISLKRSILGVTEINQNILDPVNIDVDICRCFKEPGGMTISIYNKSLQLKLTPQDFTALVMLFIDNMNEPAFEIEKNVPVKENLIESCRDYYEDTSNDQKLNAFVVKILVENASISFYQCGTFDETTKYKSKITKLHEDSLYSEINLNKFLLDFKTIETNKTLNIFLPNLTWLDSRASTPTLKKKIIFQDKVESISNLNFSYTSTPDRQECHLIVDNITFLFNAHYLKLTYDIYIAPLLKALNDDGHNVEDSEDIVDVSKPFIESDNLYNSSDITFKDNVENYSDFNFIFTIDVKNTKAIVCSGDDTSHAMFMVLELQFSYHQNELRSMIKLTLPFLNVDCAKFLGTWRSDVDFCHAIQIENVTLLLYFLKNKLIHGTVNIPAFFANVAPPTLFTLFSIKDIFTDSTIESASNETKLTELIKPAIEDSYYSEDFLKLWASQKADSALWYLAPFSPNDLVIGTDVWVRNADGFYYKMVIMKFTVGTIHLCSNEDKSVLIHSREDKIAVIPDSALHNPENDGSEALLHSIVLIEDHFGQDPLLPRCLGEICSSRVTGSSVQFQVFFYITNIKRWIEKQYIHIIPKCFVKAYPGVGLPVLVRCFDGNYRNGIIDSTKSNEYKFIVFHEDYKTCVASKTDTAAWAYYWKRFSISSKFAEVVVNTVVLLTEYTDYSVVSKPVYITSVAAFSSAKGFLYYANEYITFSLADCLYIPNQTGKRFGLGSRWLVKTGNNYLERFVLTSKSKNQITFQNNKQKFIAYDTKHYFIPDCLPESFKLFNNTEVYVLNSHGTYVEGKILKKNLIENKFDILLDDHKMLLDCNIKLIRKRMKSDNNVMNLNFSKQTRTLEKLDIIIDSVNFILEGEIDNKIIPLLHLHSKIKSELINFSMPEILVRVDIMMSLSNFNIECGDWEPIIEKINKNGLLKPWNCLIEYKNTFETLSEKVNNKQSNSDLEQESETSVLMDASNAKPFETYLTIKSSDRLEFTISNKTIETLSIASSLFSLDNNIKNANFIRNNYIIKNELGVDVYISLSDYFKNSQKQILLHDSIEIDPVRLYTPNSEDSLPNLPLMTLNIPGYKPVEKILLLRNTSFQIFLQSNQHKIDNFDSLVFPSVIIHISTEKGSKIVKLTSILRMENHLKQSLQVIFKMNENIIGSTKLFEDGAFGHCDFYSMCNNLSFVIKPSFSDRKLNIGLSKLIKNYEKPVLSAFKDKKDGPELFVILVLKTDKTVKEARNTIKVKETYIRPFVLDFLPPFLAHNQLPYKLEIGVEQDFKHSYVVGINTPIFFLNPFDSNNTLHIFLHDYLGFNWSGKFKVNHSNSKSIAISLSKYPHVKKSPSITIFVYFVVNKNIDMTFYSPNLIYNSCQVPLYLNISKLAESWKYIIPPNTVYLLKYTDKSYKASIKIKDTKFSDSFSFGAVGNRCTLLCNGKNANEEYKVSMRITTSNYFATKWIKFKPYYFLENNLNTNITIYYGKNESVQVLANSHTDFWPSTKFPMELKLCIEDRLFHTFKPNPDESIILKMGDCGVNKYDTIVVITSQQEYMTRITFADYYEGCAPIVLVNMCIKSSLSVYFKQKDTSIGYMVMPGYSTIYSWDDYDGSLQLECCFDTTFNDSIEINVKKSTLLKLDETNPSIYIATFLDGLQRVCMFSDDLRYVWRASQEKASSSLMRILFDFEGMGLSVVNHLTNVEVAYMAIKGNDPYWMLEKVSNDVSDWCVIDKVVSNEIEHYYKFYENVLNEKNLMDYNKSFFNIADTFENETKLLGAPSNEELCKGLVAINDMKRVNFIEMYMLDGGRRFNIKRIRYPGIYILTEISKEFDIRSIDMKFFNLQIDNPSISSSYSVIFSSVPMKSSVNFEKSLQKHLIEFSYSMKRPRKVGGKKIVHVEQCQLLVQKYNLNIDLSFITNIVDFISAVYNIWGDEDNIKNEKSVVSAMDDSFKNYTISPMTSNISDENSELYFIFDYLHLSPMQIYLCFSSSTNSNNKSSGIDSSMIVQAILTHIPVVNAADVKLRLSCFEMTSSNRLLPFSLLQKQIINHYTFQMLRQAFVLVLGLDVIGNPFNFVSELASGTKNLFYEPYMGSIKGPEEFAKGLGIGLRSFASGTFGNAAGVLSKMTGTLGSGLAALTFDSSYQESRRSNRREKPSNFQEGLEQGGTEFIKGVFTGLSGIVTKPIEGAQESGAEGFFKGLGKGIAGVFVKPVGGVVDFASSTLAGLKSEIKGTVITRPVRLGRAFYASGVLKTYNSSNAAGYSLFQKTLINNISDFGGFVYYFEYKKIHVFLTEWYIVCVDFDEIFCEKNIMSKYDLLLIDNLKLENDKLTFSYFSKGKDLTVQFALKNKELLKQFYDTLVDAMLFL